MGKWGCAAVQTCKPHFTRKRISKYFYTIFKKIEKKVVESHIQVKRGLHVCTAAQGITSTKLFAQSDIESVGDPRDVSEFDSPPVIPDGVTMEKSGKVRLTSGNLRRSYGKFGGVQVWEDSMKFVRILAETHPKHGQVA